MAIVALALYGAWLATALVVRALLQLRRTGDSGLRATGGGPASARWWVALLFFCALVAGPVAPVSDLAGLGLLPGARAGAVQGLGVALATLGIATIFLAQVAMGDSWRIGVDEDERTALVTGGPFHVVRNPIYSAIMLAVAGFTLMVPNVVAVISFVAVVVAIEAQVRVVEERHLARVHGTVYTEYAGAVGRFVPGVGRMR